MDDKKLDKEKRQRLHIYGANKRKEKERRTN